MDLTAVWCILNPIFTPAPTRPSSSPKRGEISESRKDAEVYRPMEDSYINGTGDIAVSRMFRGQQQQSHVVL